LIVVTIFKTLMGGKDMQSIRKEVFEYEFHHRANKYKLVSWNILGSVRIALEKLANDEYIERRREKVLEQFKQLEEKFNAR